MIASERGIRMRLVGAARRLGAAHVSARVPQGYIITPGALPAESVHPEDLVFMGFDWTHGGGQRPPPPEWRIHRDIYQAHTGAQAVVRMQSPHATALACLGRSIPAFHYEVALAGGEEIRCAPYATSGTAELARNVLEALAGRRACIVAHYGVVAFGDSLERAVALAEKVEDLARIYLIALQVGEPPCLDSAEMLRVAEALDKQRQ